LRWLEELSAAEGGAWLRLRAEAAILEARGDTGGAADKLRELEQHLAQLPDRAQRDWTLRMLRRWQAELAGPR